MVAQTQKKHLIMEKLLDNAKEISSLEYMNLSNPIFKGQTAVDNNLKYWMIFENNGSLYKIHNTL